MRAQRGGGGAHRYAPHVIFEEIQKALYPIDGVTDKVEDENKYRMTFNISQKIPDIDLGEDEEE
jgi:hypothetical protein